jgi:hypothetical protein
MGVKTTMLYTHVSNVAVEGSAVRSTGCGKLSQTRAAGPAGSVQVNLDRSYAP